MAQKRLGLSLLGLGVHCLVVDFAAEAAGAIEVRQRNVLLNRLLESHMFSRR